MIRKQNIGELKYEIKVSEEDLIKTSSSPKRNLDLTIMEKLHI